MKPPAFRYHDPHTVEEALDLLAELDQAKILAGGQSLMPMLNFRLAYPEHLVDVSRTAGMSGVEVFDDERVVRIGATTRQTACEHDTGIAAAFPLLPEALGHVGHFQTRNRGTIGGSLAHLDPAAELVAVAAAADATVHAASVRGVRSIPFASFPRGYLTSALAADELLLAVDLPLWRPGHGYAFEEFARRHGDFAVVAAAVLLDAGPDGRLRDVRVALVGLGAGPVRLAAAEQMLVNEEAGPELVAAAARSARDVPAGSDIHAPAEYRQRLAETLTRRALQRALDRVTVPEDNTWSAA